MFRAPLPIDSRPELRAAFEQGRRDRPTRHEPKSEAEVRQMMSMSADERSAYALGLAGDDELRAPAPLAIALPLLAFQLVAGLLLDTPGPRRHRWPRYAIGVPLVWHSHQVLVRAEHRRALELQLTPGSMPRSAHLAELVGPYALELLRRAWLRARGGRHPRAHSSSMAAAGNVVRALRRRYDWNQAYRRGGVQARSPSE